MLRVRRPASLSNLMSSSFPYNMVEDMMPDSALNDGLDMYEEDDRIVIKAAVPGIPADKVEITYENGVLRIQARYQETEKEKEKKKVVHRMERVSSFSYSTTFPRPVDAKNIDASVEDGVVTVSAPIAEEAKAQKIAVKQK